MHMPENFKSNKSYRLINIYERLNMGEFVNKQILADTFGVSKKTIQRDIDDLRAYFSENYQHEVDTEIKFNRAKNSYVLVRPERECLTNTEILATCKILLESRALCKEELFVIIDKLLLQATTYDKILIRNLIHSEYANFVELRHKKRLLSLIWELSNCINNCNAISFNYERQDGTASEKKVKPVSIMFSEFYFYLIAYQYDEEKSYPIVYRVDRITGMKNLEQKFYIPYKDTFSDGEFRKRVQFMYSGKLKRITFEYSGVLEAILDRLPTAQILETSGTVYTISAESFGDGILMWLQSQGDKVSIIDIKTQE
ncbi:MAG: WYL domain-containing protein [Clostridia bacterium]|nr:WYL domain-containing protein [Clostridia bacterium]